MASEDKHKEAVRPAEEAARAKDEERKGEAKPAPRKAPEGGQTGRREFGRDG